VLSLRCLSQQGRVALEIFELSFWQWIVLIQHELLLFACIFFLIGALDDFAVDFAWLWLRASRRARTHRITRADWVGAPLNGGAAVFIPTWQEAGVIGATIRHMLTVWPQSGLRLYVGCYRNDADTIAAAMQAAQGDARLRLVIHDRDGPSTKADCLNRLYGALGADEARSGAQARMVVFHDAEDMVDPAAIALLDSAMDDAWFVQLPVLALPQTDSRWIGSHYCEEFAEAHGKAMVVRDALGAALPAAGVGCSVSREALGGLARARGDGVPFAADSLTEDYELGLGIAALGGRCRFLRLRGEDDALVATRAYFPDRIDHVVRQKTRWVHGIALQGWDRMGWSPRPVEIWMRLRDRRGPLTALVLLAGYALLAFSTLGWGAAQLGQVEQVQISTGVWVLLAINVFALTWRIAMRFAFTAREFGIAEGARAVLRLPIANIIAIMAGRRALVAYVRSLRGKGVVWDKTPHFIHPAAANPRAEPA
jgi:adsorption protein B